MERSPRGGGRGTRAGNCGMSYHVVALVDEGRPTWTAIPLPGEGVEG